MRQVGFLIWAMIAGILAVLLWLAPSYGQTTFGGKFALGGKPSVPIATAAPACEALTNVNAVSVGVNIAGTNRMALAIVQYSGSPSVSSVGNGTQNATLVGTADATGQVQASFWRLLAPTLGTQTWTAQLSGIVGAASLCVINFENASGVQNFVSDAAGSSSVNLSTSSAVGNVVISAYVSANNFFNSASDTGLTYSTPGGIIVTRIGQTAGAPTVNFTASLSGSNVWTVGLIDIVRAN